MNQRFKTFLLPKWWKIFVGLFFAIVFKFITYRKWVCMCAARTTSCANYDSLNFFSMGRCSCGCTPLGTIIGNYLFSFLLPFLVGYFLISLIEILFPNKEEQALEISNKKNARSVLIAGILFTILSLIPFFLGVSILMFLLFLFPISLIIFLVAIILYSKMSDANEG